MSSERAEALHAELVERVTALQSSAQWLEAMSAAARFHEYSFGNWLLMWSQAEQRGMAVTRPAGFRTWQQLGRQVRKGERGFQILAPMVRNVGDDEGDECRRVLTGFRVATVFDVSQTDGGCLPDVGPQRLAGDDPTQLFHIAVDMIAAEGFSFGRVRLRGPNGVTNPIARTVVVDDRLKAAQRTKTTVHELAHVLMHAGTPGFECRGRVEVEAESVAYVVCRAAGLDTSAYSVPYVAGWARNTEDPTRTLLVTAETIVRTSRRILSRIDQTQAFPVELMHTGSLQWTVSADSDIMLANVVGSVGPGSRGRSAS
ncbi:MAG: ArdC-like ssDNA-binding domain-containing protein [Acidimicrobiia bacterium]